jgi:hypothetical protein
MLLKVLREATFPFTILVRSVMAPRSTDLHFYVEFVNNDEDEDSPGANQPGVAQCRDNNVVPVPFQDEVSGRGSIEAASSHLAPYPYPYPYPYLYPYPYPYLYPYPLPLTPYPLTPYPITLL